MQFYPLRAGQTKLLAILLFAVLTLSGCKPNEQNKKLYAVYACGDIAITVEYTKQKGVDHKAVYLCSDNAKNYTITWIRGPNVKSFQVQFDGPDYPFGPASATFGTGGTTTTPPLPAPGELTVFKYQLTIVDDGGTSHPFDPHVVGGGNLAMYLKAD